MLYKRILWVLALLPLVFLVGQTFLSAVVGQTFAVLGTRRSVLSTRHPVRQVRVVLRQRAGDGFRRGRP